MKRTSKYINKHFGNWTCTHVGVSYVQSKKTHEGLPSKRPGHQTYYYIFERRTSDGKAEKLVRLSALEAARVYRGETSVESIAKARKTSGTHEFTTKVSYHFIDRQ